MWSKIKSRIWTSKHDVLVGESPIVSEAKINKAINKIDATMDESEKQKLGSIRNSVYEAQPMRF